MEEDAYGSDSSDGSSCSPSDEESDDDMTTSDTTFYDPQEIESRLLRLLENACTMLTTRTGESDLRREVKVILSRLRKVEGEERLAIVRRFLIPVYACLPIRWGILRERWLYLHQMFSDQQELVPEVCEFLMNVESVQGMKVAAGLVAYLTAR
jgi:hypothetical protein